MALLPSYWPHGRSVTCLDLSKRVVEAGQQRLAGFADNVRFEQGDMHEVAPRRPIDRHDTDAACPDCTRRPEAVFGEVRRVLRKDGVLLAVTLAQHRHEKAVAPYGHENLGFQEQEAARALRICRPGSEALRH